MQEFLSTVTPWTLLIAIVGFTVFLIRLEGKLTVLTRENRATQRELDKAAEDRKALATALALHAQDSEKHVNHEYLRQIEKQLDSVANGQKSIEDKLDNVIASFLSQISKRG